MLIYRHHVYPLMLRVLDGKLFAKSYMIKSDFVEFIQGFVCTICCETDHGLFAPPLWPFSLSITIQSQA